MKKQFYKWVLVGVGGLMCLSPTTFAAGSSVTGSPVYAAPNCTGLNPAIAFSGTVDIDQYGNISTDKNSPLILSGKIKKGSKYKFGRIATVDGNTLEFNLKKISGSKAKIKGVYIAAMDVVEVLNSLNGSSDSVGCTYVSSVGIDQMGAEPMKEASPVIGNQPFKFALVSGQLILNGSAGVPY